MKYLIIILIAIAGVFGAGWYAYSRPAPLDGFTQCLGEKGATFYGAFWCPHCQNQKKLFGRSERLLPYVECSTPDGRSQLPRCAGQKIEGYPTWEFKDGSRKSGEVPLAELAKTTGCSLPQ